MKLANLVSFFRPKSISNPERAALKSFLHNFHWGESLSNAEAKTNLEQGVVEIVDNKGDHSFNGLLVSNDGYFLTSYHCVDEKIQGYRVRLHNKESYPIKKVCRFSRDSDIALAKSELPGEPKAMQYRFLNGLKSSSPLLVVLLSRRDGTLSTKGGRLDGNRTRTIESPEIKMSDQLVSSIITAPGDSGGTVVTMDYRVCGLHTGRFAYNGTNYSRCTFLYQALQLVSDLAN